MASTTYLPRVDPKTGKPIVSAGTTTTSLASTAPRLPGVAPTYSGPLYSQLASTPGPTAASAPISAAAVGTGSSALPSGAQSTSNAAGVFGGTGTAYPAEKTLYGAASDFTNAYLPAVLANPDVITARMMQNRGIDPFGQGTGLMTAMSPYMDAVRALLPLAWGGEMPPSTSSPINWMDQRAKMGITPGGPAFDFRTVMNTLGHLGKGSDTYQMLYGEGMSPEDQVNATKQMVYAAAQLGLPPEFQRSVQNQMNAAALKFYLDQYQGGTPRNFGSFVPRFY